MPAPRHRILLHTCCAPCLIHPLEVLTRRGYEVVPFFYNPNVHPWREYRERYLAVAAYCEEQGLRLRVGPYEMERFLAEVSPLEAGAAGESRVRCERCFAMRLSAAAVEARRVDAAEFTTTLLVSPYQDKRLIALAGEHASLGHGVLFLFEDMSAGYRDSVEASRTTGMYRQSYCGCVYSEKERYQKGDPPPR
ncbi:MAG: epoxyqueuosine reductase QueH [Actinobacteria bacterium]|nr:epoxyqueuosine reductase QueH [Actinomycetota bacterium]MBU1942101.1 epoxyqueuosine reductase QueH [Actinomycetota bacterium]